MSKVFNNQNFQTEVLESSNKKLVIVDFYADWCAPCRMLAPIIEEIEKEMGDKIIIGKLNIEDNNEIASKYNIMSIPAILFFKNGEIIESLIGLQSKENIIDVIKKHI